MSDEERHECSGCYIWENDIGAICDYTPVIEGKLVCPCVTCLVKSMCLDIISCDEFMEVYNPERVGCEE